MLRKDVAEQILVRSDDMKLFQVAYEEWLERQIDEERNDRRKELLMQGLGHGTMEFLRLIWYPAIQNFDYLYAEYEVRDLNNRVRYLDLAYLPGSGKGCIEIHGFASHARDIETSRFKDLCMKQALLVLDNWSFIPIAYLSIRDDPEVCKQVVLAFVGKFLSMDVPAQLNPIEAEVIRFAQRLARPFEPKELADHLRYSVQHARSILHQLVNKQILMIASGNQRYRTYCLPQDGNRYEQPHA